MQTLQFLGRGSAFNKEENNNSCYFVKKGIFVLIDCGEGTMEALQKSHAFKGVKEIYIVITHSHNDHISDLPKVLDYATDVLKTTPKILNTLSLQNNALEKLGIKEGRDFSFVEPISKNFKWINTLVVPHAKDMDTCALEIKLDDKKIFYSSDCKDIPFEIQGYDEYYFDCSENKNELHMDINKIKELIKKNKIKKQNVFLMHIESQKTLEIAKGEGIQVVETVVTKDLIKVITKKKPATRTYVSSITK